MSAVTDPIADLLTRIRNAQRAHHDELKCPGSKLKLVDRKTGKSVRLELRS